MCGQGKTSWAIRYIAEYHKIFGMMNMGFIYCTPFLDEINRVKKELQKEDVDMYEPESYKGKGTKLEHLKKLILQKKNIILTHSLLSNCDAELLELIRKSGYILILDEVFEVLKRYNMSDEDYKLLEQQKCIEVDENGKVNWVNEEYNNGKFIEFKTLCQLGAIFKLPQNKLYMWTFPVELFYYMSAVYILTYQFKGQLQCYYYDLYKVPYNMKYVIKENENYKLIDWKEEYDKENIKAIMPLVNIYEGKLNPNHNISLSSTHLRNANPAFLKIMQNNVYNYFRHVCNGTSDSNMWTTLKELKPKLKGKGYTKGFVSLGARATNNYRHKENLAFIFNVYLNPIDKQFFTSRGVKVDENLFALSNLIQWVWRSTIRDNRPINIYIPSYRMRTLFQNYLQCK